MLNTNKLNRLRILTITIFSFLLVAACTEISKNAVAQRDDNLQPVGNTSQTNDLFKSLKSKNFDRVKELVRSGANLDQREEDGDTVLQIAMLMTIPENNLDILEFLLKSGANPNMAIQSGSHPLEKAIWSNDNRIAFLLLQYGADVNTKFDDRSVLTESIMLGKKELPAYLLTHGARVNEPNKIGRTELFYVKGERDELVKLLIEKGADVNHKDNDGLTPLFMAVEYNDIKLIHMLVENGANVNEQDKDGWTPLQQALVSGCNDVVEYLKKHGANLK